jgi:hypothetical protein
LVWAPISSRVCVSTHPLSAVIHKRGPTSNQLSSTIIPHQRSTNSSVGPTVNYTRTRPASAMGDIPLQRWSTSEWKIFFSDRGPHVREITECLGLSCDSHHSILKFSEPESNKLFESVQEVSKSLPKDLDDLLISASRSDGLDKELKKLLNTFGTEIWGRDVRDRKRLLLAPRLDSGYSRDLFYDVSEDRKM